MTTQELASEIYLRAIQDRILAGGPKAWSVEPKEARRIAKASLEAADIFFETCDDWNLPDSQLVAKQMKE